MVTSQPELPSDNRTKSGASPDSFLRLKDQSSMNNTHAHDKESTMPVKKETWQTPELLELPTDQTAGGANATIFEGFIYKPAS
ncbi:MAG: hypothetical protein KDA89_05545 [Planctomycetaceae bacterium]|nr:hypothetical protein [Planctomycetaceae bacterium]